MVNSSLTSVGTLNSLTVSGTSALQAITGTNLSLTSSGLVTGNFPAGTVTSSGVLYGTEFYLDGNNAGMYYNTFI
eukprot:15141-Eustigmatos_ZCMA.PRE.1